MGLRVRRPVLARYSLYPDSRRLLHAQLASASDIMDTVKPGSPPSWGPGGKSAVGTAIGNQSSVWFTMAEGCLTEIYYPRPDIANTRAVFFVLTDGAGFFSDERRHTVQTIRMRESGVPLYESENRCGRNRYNISKVTFADPFRDVLLQRVRFEKTLPGDPLQLWVFIAPALNNKAYGNNGWLDRQSGAFVVAEDSLVMAMMASNGFSGAACTYQGPSDLWHQLKSGIATGKLTDRAEDGNLLLAGQINLSPQGNEVVFAISFGESAARAIHLAHESLSQDFDELADAFVEGWREYRVKCVNLRGISTGEIYETSIAVMKSHQSKKPLGGLVASLAIPWGSSEQQGLDFRYQISWTRDAVQGATAFLAIGDHDSARLAWQFLVSTQQRDGHWPQNMWLDGTPHWSGIQMDETALPILLADMLRRHGAARTGDLWPTVKRAAAYLVQNGPGTEEDRWEDAGGYSPYTLAIEIAGLLAAADIAEAEDENSIAEYLRALADWWNDNVERWTYIDDHYVRLSTPRKNRAGEIRDVMIKESAHAHSPASLALVRFGLRAADDPRIRDTVADIDRHLRSETATGTVWHRYPGDHYGEFDDGRPFDGIGGAGRGWPLLAGERAHYEIARGNFQEARRLVSVIEKQTSACGLIPEQVWDKADLPGSGLYNGRPSGSAMPLVWAHAEYIKLLRSLRDGVVFDTPPQPVERYQKRNTKSPYVFWNPDHKVPDLPAGRLLRIQARKRAMVYWTLDGWRTTQTTAMKDSELGPYYCDLPAASEPVGRVLAFTLFWEDRTWENRAYQLPVVNWLERSSLRREA